MNIFKAEFEPPKTLNSTLLNAEFLFQELTPHLESQLEDQRRNESERAGAAHEEKQAARTKLKALERELKNLDAQQAEATRARDAAAAEKQTAVGLHARLELDVRDLQEGLSSSSKTQVRPENSLCFRFFFQCRT